MVFLLFVCGIVAAILVRPLGLRPSPTFAMPTQASVILGGAVIVLIGPVAEEVFWRGYVLEQLRRLVRPAAALLIQSLFFGLVHLHGSHGCLASIQAFLLGVVLGMWRLRLRSLLPLMLAHMIFNGVVSIPMLRQQYQLAQLIQPVADDRAEYFKNVRSNPKCRRIEAPSREPAQKAVPGIIHYFASPDEHVRTYAAEVLVQYFRREAEPYLKAPLSSSDKNTVHGALTVVGFCGYLAYKQQVRDVAQSADDSAIQALAVVTLQDLKDEEGLRGIAQSHPKARVREIAERCLARMPE